MSTSGDSPEAFEPWKQFENRVQLQRQSIALLLQPVWIYQIRYFANQNLLYNYEIDNFSFSKFPVDTIAVIS